MMYVCPTFCSLCSYPRLLSLPQGISVQHFGGSSTGLRTVSIMSAFPRGDAWCKVMRVKDCWPALPELWTRGPSSSPTPILLWELNAANPWASPDSLQAHITLRVTDKLISHSPLFIKILTLESILQSFGSRGYSLVPSKSFPSIVARVHLHACLKSRPVASHNHESSVLGGTVSVI